jgi:hypothetical protein
MLARFGCALAAFAALSLTIPMPTAVSEVSAPPGVVRAPALHVDGTKIVGDDGKQIQLNGVNRSGTEYACVQGWGIFDGPSTAKSIEPMREWHVHAVRIPLNEDCWLGINGVDEQYGGAAYRSAVSSYVRRLERAGMNPILDLHWTAPGDELADGQRPMPDADHSPDFWRSVAKRFGADQAVVFDLFNEPHDVTWHCWRSGCRIDGWRAVGMQRLVDVVRRTGATNVIMVGGLGWAGDLTAWGARRPNDPLRQLAASWHTYDFGSCVTEECWQSQLDGVDGRAPMVIGEFGETDCAHGYVDRLMEWADDARLGYLAWTWDDWPNCDGPTLITSYDGTPTAYGIGVRDHFLARFPPLPTS